MIKQIRLILKAFADNGLFEEGVELIGSWCFKLYQEHLGATAFPLLTQDIDFLIPNPWHGKEHHDFIARLEKLGFLCDANRDGSIYLWNEELKIEFISPEKGRGTDSSIKIKKLGINAIALRFVGLLLDNPITIRDNGIDVRVPNPANYCLHKLIIASRRRKTDKSLKDLQQAVCTSSIVDQKEIKALYDSLPSKWKKAIDRMLEKAGKELPLLEDGIIRLKITLQDVNK